MTADLAAVAAAVEAIECPWPEDVFGPDPGSQEWAAIDAFVRERGYRIDRVSGTLMRRGWEVFRWQLQERLADLVDEDEL